MRNLKSLLPIALLFLLSAPAFALDGPGDHRSLAQAGSVNAEITAVLHDFYEASTQGDIAGIASAISHDPAVMFFGTDPDEVFVGHNNIVQWWQVIFDFLEAEGYPNGSLPIIPTGSPVQIDRQGQVVWVADQPIFQLHGGDVPCRFTFVFRKEQGRWKIVQGHLSIGVPDETLPF